MKKVKLGVLISGGGSNMQSIIDRIEAGALSAEIVVVISNEPDAGGLDRAARHGLPSEVINHRGYADRLDFDRALVEVLKKYGAELVILAGFMRLVGQPLLEAYPQRIMNIHPALLPSFPGTHVWQTELDYGVKFAGCTVHFVDAGTDSGPIIIQAVVPVLDDDDADSLAARILKQEHRIYPRAIQLYAEGRLTIEGRRVKVTPVDRSQDEVTLANPSLDQGGS